MTVYYFLISSSQKTLHHYATSMNIQRRTAERPRFFVPRTMARVQSFNLVAFAQYRVA